ncbi:MAG: hypothetical protein IJB32_00455 [Clostridia bacterium]|nr:hypothetical protein [Clostridia bacterium]
MGIEAIITVSVTLVLGIIGFIVNTLLQRKNNSIKIITQYRIDRKNSTQEITAKLLSYTDYHFHMSLTDEEKRKNVQNIVKEVANLRSVYYFSFPKDAEFVKAAYSLKNAYCEEKKDWNKISIAQANFAHISDIYTSTDWKRIKLETVGKGRSTKSALPSWTEIYKQNDSYFLNDANIALFSEERKK